MHTNTERQHANDRRRRERPARDLSQREPNVGQDGFDP
jgi:hypothetical protein